MEKKPKKSKYLKNIYGLLFRETRPDEFLKKCNLKEVLLLFSV